MVIARQTQNIEIYRGDSIYVELEVLDTDDAPVNLTNYTMRSQIRRHVDGSIIATLSPVFINAALGTVYVSAPASATVDLDLGPDNEGVWDLELSSDAATPVVTTSHRGTVSWVLDITE